MVDELLRPLKKDELKKDQGGHEGTAPELWHMAERHPPDEWSPAAKLTLQMCVDAIKHSYALAFKCSNKVQQQGKTNQSDGEGLASCLPADLHASHFLLPLLQVRCYILESLPAGRTQAQPQ